MTKIPKDEALEIIVASLLPGGYRTKASGAVHHEGDVRSTSRGSAGDFIIECKYRSRPNFILTAEVVDKLITECLPRGKKPVWVLENSEGDRIACLRLDDLTDLLE